MRELALTGGLADVIEPLVGVDDDDGDAREPAAQRGDLPVEQGVVELGDGVGHLVAPGCAPEGDCADGRHAPKGAHVQEHKVPQPQGVERLHQQRCVGRDVEKRRGGVVNGGREGGRKGLVGREGGVLREGGREGGQGRT